MFPLVNDTRVSPNSFSVPVRVWAVPKPATLLTASVACCDDEPSSSMVPVLVIFAAVRVVDEARDPFPICRLFVLAKVPPTVRDDPPCPPYSRGAGRHRS